MSENPEFIDRDLLARIERCMAETDMKPWEFGRKAINDPALVDQLRDGRWMRPQTRQKVEAFLAEHQAGAGAKNVRAS